MKVVIIGGGPAGLIAAISAAQENNEVITLSEMRSRAADNTVEPVKVRLKTATHKIMNATTSFSI